MRYREPVVFPSEQDPLSDLIESCPVYGAPTGNTVKRVSGVDFPVRLASRRAGDPAALVAGAQRIREALGWEPQHDDLEEIVTHALAWEAHLAAKQVALAG